MSSAAPAVKPKLAYVRFWNMLPGKTSDSFELLTAENKPLAIAAPSNYYATYMAVPPGAFNFIVRRQTDNAAPLRHLPVTLLADSYITILVSDKDGQPSVEGINDTIDPKDAGVRRLVLRQYMPGARVTASVGAAPPTAALNYGEAMTLDNLPASPVMVRLEATFASGPVRSWTVPADFTSDFHDTLLIVADPYGRFRPRLATDGPHVDPPTGNLH